MSIIVFIQRISQVQRDRRIVDERELSDSEDEDGDKRRDHSEAKPIAKKRKTSSEAVNGIPEIPSASSTEPATLTQVTTITETNVKIPSTTDETTTIKEVTETTTVVVKDEPSTIVTEKNDVEESK